MKLRARSEGSPRIEPVAICTAKYVATSSKICAGPRHSGESSAAGRVLGQRDAHHRALAEHVVDAVVRDRAQVGRDSAPGSAASTDAERRAPQASSRIASSSARFEPKCRKSVASLTPARSATSRVVVPRVPLRSKSSRAAARIRARVSSTPAESVAGREHQFFFVKTESSSATFVL